MSKPHIYRPGDQVRIVRSRFIKRIGYPLTWMDLTVEIAADPRVRQAADLLDIPVTSDFTKGIAMATVKARGFGGRERAIHYFETVPASILHCSPDGYLDYTGQTTVIDRKYMRNTGTYYAPVGGQDYEGEYWYESGGLTDRRAHVILETGLGTIEACDVEPYSAA